MIRSFSGLCSHLLVVSTHSTGRSFLCRAGSDGFSLGIAGRTVVGGFGRHGLHSGRMSVVARTVSGGHPIERSTLRLRPHQTLKVEDKDKVK